METFQGMKTAVLEAGQIVAGNKWKVFAKANSCRGTPDTVNLTDLDSNTYVNLAKPRRRSVIGCDPPCRRSTEGRNEQSVLGATSGSNADQNFCRLHEKVERKFVEVRNSASTESACKSEFPTRNVRHGRTRVAHEQ
jgi:hypothetical protein